MVWRSWRPSLPLLRFKALKKLASYQRFKSSCLKSRDGNGSDRFGHPWYPNPNSKIFTKLEPDPNPFGFEKQKPEPDPTDLDRFRVLSKPELLQTPQSHDADGASIWLTPASSNTYVIQLPTNTSVIQPSPNPQLCIHSLFFADYITNTMASGQRTWWRNGGGG